MFLIQIEPMENTYYHPMHEQYGGTEVNWLGEEWIEVPDELRALAWSTIGYCDLVIEDGVLVNIIPREPPEPPEPPEQKYTPQEKDEFLEGLMEGFGYESEVNANE